jgi:hypothetical protein
MPQEATMLKILAIIIALILLAVAAIVAYAATRPDGFRVQRTLKINAPADRIFPLINDFKAWDAWSPWEKKDPGMKRTYGGPATGKGSTYAWEGNKEVGKGKIVIAEATPPSKVVLDMHFMEPFEARNNAEFTLEPQGDGTNVTWAMYGPTPLMMKVVHLFMNMDKMVGGEFEKGLAAMKAKAEK